MKKILSAFTLCLFLAISFVFAPSPADAFAGKSPGGLNIKPQTSKIQLPFIANEGQIDNRVRYYAQTFNGSFFVTQNGELVYSIEKPRKTDGGKERSERAVIREIFTGDIKALSFKGEGEGTKISIYKGNEPAKWKRNIPSYEQISMGDIYQGIEIKLKAYGDTIEKIFSVKPGADPKAIRSRIEGAKNIQVNEKGELEFQTDIGTAVFSKPVAYQIKGQGEKGKELREYIQVAYAVEGNQYIFIVGDYDKTRELVIDPYVGVKIQGSAEDRAYAVMTFLDEGETTQTFVFVAGYSYSSNFPFNQTFGTSGTSDADVFVARFTEDLGTVEQIVFIAGTGDDFGYSLAMDSSKNIYVAGTTTSSDLPIPIEYTPYDKTYNGGTDVFVAKLSYDLNSLIALTYLGGSSLDAVNADSLAIDGMNNNVIVAGYTTSTEETGFPTPDTYAYDTFHHDGEDVFIAIFNTGLEGYPDPIPGLESLKSTTFIGGSGNERPYAMALRTEYSTEIYVAGYTTSTDYPIIAGAYDTVYNEGTNDAFISRIMPSLVTPMSPLRSLASSTFVGGSGIDEIHGLAISGSPDYYVYVTGNTDSTDFPGSCISSVCDGMDVFIAQFGTFLTDISPTPIFVQLGGADDDYAKSLILSGGVVYVSGVTYSQDFPVTAFDTSFGGTQGLNSDGFILSMSSLASIYASTYLGGSADDFAPAIASDTAGNIYVAGSTNSTDFPTTLTSYGGSSGGFEAYVAKLDYMLQGTSCIYTFNPENTTVSAAGGNFSFSLTTSEGCAWDASTEDSWITTSSSGSDSGTVNYTVDPNTGRVLQGMIAIAGKYFIVTQNGVGSSRITDSSTGHQYQRFDELLDRNAAQSHCQGLSGHLVTITSALEQTFVYTNLVSGGTTELHDCWTGASQTPCTPEPTCGWQWLTGETWGYENWGMYEPNNAYGIENSIVMLTSDGNWNDFNETALQSFVCEWDTPLTYTLNVTKSGTGTGTVTSTETPTPKINCGSTCSASYTAGASVTLNAAASSNSAFAGWSGAGCSGTGSCTFAMNSDNTVIATFTKTKFTVTPIFDQHGTMNPSTPQVINSGQTVPFTITPSSGYRILYVGGSCGGSLSENVYTTNPVTADCNVMAFFTSNTLRVTASAGQGGSISPTSATVNYGGTVQFTVTPDDGYHVALVSGCGVTKYEGGVIAAKKKKKKNVKTSAAGEVYITGPITADCTVSASFAINTFTVTPSAGEHGNINPSIQQTVNYNDTVPFSVKADDGYHIQSVSGCNGTAYTAAKKKKKKKLSAVSEMTYTTGHITESCTVTASFAINTFTVTPKAGEHGSIDPSAPLTVNYLDTVSFTVKPDEGCHIESVTGCGIHPSEGGTYITDPITGDCTVEAAFVKETFTTTILKSGTGNGTITGSGVTCEGNACEGTYEAGSKLTLKIKPDDGYRVIDVKINGKSIGPVQTLTLKEIMSNFTIEIIFGPA